MLIGGVALVVLAGIGLVMALRAWHRLARLRHAGRGVTGEVIDVEIHGYYSFRSTAPVARYVVDGRVHESVVGNYAGRADLHTQLDLLVDPTDPTTVVSVHGNQSVTTTVASLCFIAFGLACCVWGR